MAQLGIRIRKSQDDSVQSFSWDTQLPQEIEIPDQFSYLATFVEHVSVTHTIARILADQNDVNLEFLRYLDEKVSELLRLSGRGRILAREALKRLAAKLKNDAEFFSAVAEIEWAVHLCRLGIVTIEPRYPERGPDLNLAIGRMRTNLEITGIGADPGVELWREVAAYIGRRVRRIVSHYTVTFRVRLRDYLPHSPALKRAVGATVGTLNKLEGNLPNEAFLYYFPDKPPLVLDRRPSGLDRSNCGFCVHFERRHDVPVGTPCIGPSFSYYDANVQRLLSILHDKRKQLIKGEANVVVVDSTDKEVTEQNFLDALYGESYTLINPATGFESSGRKANGFFTHTTRLQAVVMYRRPSTGSTTPTRLVFASDNPKARPAPIELPLSAIGDLYPACQIHLCD